MDPTTVTDTATKIRYVEPVKGALDGDPTRAQPLGDTTKEDMRVSALKTEGINIGFTRYRPTDITGRHPVWYEIVYNMGDIDEAPQVILFGPRDRQVPGLPPNTNPNWPYEGRQFGEE